MGFPFSHIIAKVYDDISYLSFLSLSSFIYFHYIVFIIKLNLIYFVKVDMGYLTIYMHLYLPYLIIPLLLIISLLYSAYLLDKMCTIKSFWAISSLTNLPMLILALTSGNHLTRD